MGRHTSLLLEVAMYIVAKSGLLRILIWEVQLCLVDME